MNTKPKVTNLQIRLNMVSGISRYIFLGLFLLAGLTTVIGAAAAPVITSPAPGSTLSGTSETFQWSANGSAVTEWWVYVGTSVGGKEIYDSGSLGSSTSTTVSRLPTDGSTVWVRLWYVDGDWQWVDFQYTAMEIGDPEIVLPLPGSLLTGATETFQWSANGTPVNEWWLYVGTTVGGNDLYDSGSIDSSTLAATVTGLPTDGSTVWVRLWYDSDHWHDVDFQYVTPNLNGIPVIISPADNGFVSPVDVMVQASASGFPANWSVDFVLDNQFGSPIHGIPAGGTWTWEASLGDLSTGTHTLTAVMVDEFSQQQPELAHEISFDVGDYLVIFGDSISEGIGDDDSSDNQSADGRNTSPGMAPILNDLLTGAKSYPHNVVVRGISGYESGDGLDEIINALSDHPESNYFLIMFGTNDASPSLPVPHGLGLEPGDAGYPGSYKDNMQRIIDEVQAAGKIALLAKPPVSYGDCTGPSVCQSFVQLGIAPEDAVANKDYLQKYGQVVDQLITENGLELDPVGSPGILFVAPDLYIHYLGTGLDGAGKSPVFDDWLHPNGTGYQDMADLWLLSLVP